MGLQAAYRLGMFESFSLSLFLSLSFRCPPPPTTTTTLISSPAAAAAAPLHPRSGHICGHAEEPPASSDLTNPRMERRCFGPHSDSLTILFQPVFFFILLSSTSMSSLSALKRRRSVKNKPVCCSSSKFQICLVSFSPFQTVNVCCFGF